MDDQPEALFDSKETSEAHERKSGSERASAACTVLGSCTTFYLDTEIAFILFYEKANAILCLFLRNGGKRYSFMG